MTRQDDIFNGSRPYKVFFFCIRRYDFNGTANTNAIQMCWEGITNFLFAINGTAVRLKIENFQQAYWHLQKALHREN